MNTLAKNNTFWPSTSFFDDFLTKDLFDWSGPANNGGSIPRVNIMKGSFLDYYKLILDKVSFDPVLFQKEYKKAHKILEESEAKQLDRWLQTKGLYSKLCTVRTHQNINTRAFNKAY